MPRPLIMRRQGMTNSIIWSGRRPLHSTAASQVDSRVQWAGDKLSGTHPPTFIHQHWTQGHPSLGWPYRIKQFYKCSKLITSMSQLAYILRNIYLDKTGTCDILDYQNRHFVSPHNMW